MRISFLKARDGNVAMIFALCLVPLLVLMGGAVDLSRQRGAEVNVQNAVDAALLAVAHSALDKNAQQLTKDGRVWLDQEMLTSNIEITSFTIIKTDKTLTAEVTADIDTSFLAIMGMKSLTVKRRASVQYGVRNVEVALVLDTTGSMENIASGTCGAPGCAGGKSKLAVLKEAATSMMNTLEYTSSGSDQMKVGIVPFATYVNVGPDNLGEKWIDDEGKSSVSADNFAEGLSRTDMIEHLGSTWKGCVQTRPHNHDVRDTAPKISDPDTLFVPHFNPDEPDPAGAGQDYPDNYVGDSGIDLGDPLLNIANPMKYGVPSAILPKINGVTSVTLNNLVNLPGGIVVPAGVTLGRDDCLEDYDNDNGYGNNTCTDPLNDNNWANVTLNPNYVYYSDVKSSIGPGFSCEMSPLTPLTANFDKLRTQINAMVASGSTNITEGIMWGWRVLSPGLPFKEGSKYSSETTKVLVLLSDGNNMIVKRPNHPGGSDFSAYGYIANERLDGISKSSTQTQILDRMDELTLEACTNIKNKGIEIYTIRLDLTDARSQKILSTCATDSDHFIDAKNTEELTKAFETITKEITTLYLTE